MKPSGVARGRGGAVARVAASAALALGVAGCEVGLAPRLGATGGGGLVDGVYVYEAWSDRARGGPAWWGYLDLEVALGGEIVGVYRLPWQCSDAYGYEVDCVGRVAGRVYRDGTLRFGLDEGWLRHEGRIRSGSRVLGEWETRLLGYYDAGTFELAPRSRW